MTALLDVLLRAALLCTYVLVPGWAALRLVGFRSRSRLDALLACLVLGSAWTAEAVTLLLFVGAYFRLTALLVLIAPVLLLVALRRRDARTPSELALVAPQPGGIDRAVLVAAAAFVAVYLVDAATSPMTWWDGLASWGKWAPDWGRRTSSHGYLVGGYPQLVPRIISVLYKLTGTHSEILPLDFFAAHVFYVLFSAWFTVAAVRLSQLLEIPAWPATLAGLGSVLFREHIGAGTVDVLVAAQVTTLVALLAGHVRRTWHAAMGGWWVLGSSVFAALFTKLTGVVAPAFLLMLAGPLCRRFACPDLADVRRTAWRGVALGLLLFLPFVLEQGLTEMRLGSFAPDVREVNLSIRQIPALLAHDAEVTYRGGGMAARPHLIQLRFWNSYDVPATLRMLFTAGFVVCLGLSLLTWFGRATLPLLVPYTLVWAVWSSYDQRNLFPVLPLLGVAACVGAMRAWEVRPHALSRNAIAIFSGLFLLLAGGAILKDVQARLLAMRSGPQPLAARLRAMSSDPQARIHLYFPALAGDYEYMRELAQRTAARHVLVTSPMFRFFENGAHALSLWPYERVQPGDLFGGHEWHRPPPDQRWVLLRAGARHTVWIFEPGLVDATLPPAAAVTDGGRSWSYSVVPPLTGGEMLVWEAGTEGAGPWSAGYEGGHDERGLTSCVVDEGEGTTGRISGLLVTPQGKPATIRLSSLTPESRVVSFRVKRRGSRSSGPAAPPPGPASAPATTACAQIPPPAQPGRTNP